MGLRCADSTRYNCARSGSSSVAERQLPKLNVAGSIPVSRSRFSPFLSTPRRSPGSKLFCETMQNGAQVIRLSAVSLCCEARRRFRRLTACGVSLLGQFGVVLEALGLGQKGDGLGDLWIPLGADLEALELSELRGEELALDALFDPVVDASDVGVVVVDLVGLEEVLKLLYHRIVDFEVFCDCVGGQVMLAEVEEGVVSKEAFLKGIGLQVVDLFIGSDASTAVDSPAGVGELDLEVALVLGLVFVVAHVVVVVERDVVVVALDQAAGGRVVVVGGESEARVLCDGEDGLDQTLAEGGFADDQGAIVILQGAGDDFSG